MFNSVWDIEQFFENSPNWDKYEEFYYDGNPNVYEEHGDLYFAMSSVVCDLFSLDFFSHGCSRSVFRFGDYVAKVCIEPSEWSCANDRELELINLLYKKNRLDLVDYLVPIVGSIKSKRYYENLVIVSPLCDSLDDSREVLSPDEAEELGKEIYNEFFKAGVVLDDISISSNYGFYKGRWRLLDFAEWSFASC